MTEDVEAQLRETQKELIKLAGLYGEARGIIRGMLDVESVQARIVARSFLASKEQSGG